MSVRDNVLASVERTAWLWQRVGGAARRHAAEAALDRTGLLAMAGRGRWTWPTRRAKFLSLARILATGARIWLLGRAGLGARPGVTQSLRGAAAPMRWRMA